MSEDRIKRLLAGERRALARVLSHVENKTPEGHRALRSVYPHTGRAHIIGVTGPAGSGKSTLVGALAREMRRRGRTVGVVAVDPSSPYTQGAVLGDRIRMQDLTADSGVFVRSMASRGGLGGLAETAGDLTAVLDAAGFDIVMLETVGAGQDEVDVAHAAHTTVVVNTPGAGDGVQALKAGILEIADILVVNKADLPGADALAAELGAMIALAPESGYRPPILRTNGLDESGVPELADAIEAHRTGLEEGGALEQSRLEIARREVIEAARGALLRRIMAVAGGSALDEAVRRVAARELDPHSAALELLSGVFVRDEG